MVGRIAQRLVPDALWDTAKPLLPVFSPRPQGGGTSPVDERTVFTAVVFVLTSGCAWQHLPSSFGVSVPTAHRRFMVWADTGGDFYPGDLLTALLRCHARTSHSAELTT